MTKLYESLAVSALRIVAALLFIEHGTQKLFGFPMPPPHGLPQFPSIFWFAGAMEVAGGVLLLIGFLSRPVAFLLAGEMAVAYWMVHAPNGPFPVLNGGDAAILFCFVFLTLVFTGPGYVSVDHSLSKMSRARAP
jgi:putative oxidoreductase